ncbi:hypothetical protein Poly59_25540 [Rubripirellula reticaptiva]|uniref:Uncharacterized protein n=2 Tax=Rubripirellula reticaptiva TaxID=2528013 RepID=A0A5C6F6Q0_9BACT|nr:hypothetical protein Poly59_25540 [Rubripirellula reticaptiva]
MKFKNISSSAIKEKHDGVWVKQQAARQSIRTLTYFCAGIPDAHGLGWQRRSGWRSYDICRSKMMVESPRRKNVWRYLTVGTAKLVCVAELFRQLNAGGNLADCHVAWHSVLIDQVVNLHDDAKRIGVSECGFAAGERKDLAAAIV